MYIDQTGNFPWIAIGALVGAVISAGIDLYYQSDGFKNWDNINWKKTAVAAGSGAISGALGASGIGLAGQIIGNAVIAGTASVVGDVVSGDDINWARVALDTGIGTFVGFVGGKGLQQGLKTSAHQITNASGKYFSTVTLTYTNETMAREMSKEFLKGVAKGTATEIFINGNVLTFIYEVFDVDAYSDEEIPTGATVLRHGGRLYVV